MGITKDFMLNVLEKYNLTITQEIIDFLNSIDSNSKSASKMI